MTRRGLALLLIASTAAAGPRRHGKPAKPATPAPAPAPPPAPAPDTPWSAGVPQDVQDKANALYDEGNQLFAQQAHEAALEKYKQAIALWDHPLIRFNMAVTEIRLDRVLDASVDLEKALRYGAAPFKPELYQQALDYQALLKGRVGFVEASCDQRGAHVLLDGKPWFDCPGKQKLRVTAGEHAVVGTAEGFVTTSQKLVVSGGATATAALRFISLEDAVVLHYPYRRWIPWTGAGLGLTIGLAGAGTYLLAKNQMNQFEADFTAQCATGCEPGLTDPSHRPLRQERDGAVLDGKIGVTLMVVGGAGAIAGLVFAILDRPTKSLPQVEVAPTAGGMAASASWRW